MDFDVLIIGAGVIGLSAAEKFSRQGYSVIVIEKESRHGTGISSRNSEVIHAGIYYPPNSLKSNLCVKGKNLLYEWCSKYNIAHKKIGKFIVAVEKDEIEILEKIKENSIYSGMKDLQFVPAGEVNSKEPNIKCETALFSPTTGIISAHEFIDSLKFTAEQNGADLVFNSKIKSVTKNSQSNGYFAEIEEFNGEITLIEVNSIINCAGLYADKVSEILNTFSKNYQQHFVKGNYFKLYRGKNLFHHLIYPVPNSNLKGLGIHVTLDLNGEVRFGPDMEVMNENEENYNVDENRRLDFYKSIKKYFPKIEEVKLTPDFSGIRPRLTTNAFNDFIINEESGKGFPKIVNCIGIESPGLTSSLAIANHIFDLLT